MLILLAIASLFHPPIALPHSKAADFPRFKYVLPEGFHGWACVDFGVKSAPPLKRDEGVYVIEPNRDSIVQTSSLPSLATPPFPSEVIQITNRESRTVEVDEIQQRGEYDTNSPIARYCLFFGSAASAAAFKRPPTLTESRLGTEPVLQHFEFSKGNLCDFLDVSRLCLEAEDVSRQPVANNIARALEDRIAVTDNCDGFDDVVVRYRADRAVQTHSSSRGPRFAFAELRREDKRTGTKALVTWSSTDGGSARAVAERFGRDLAAFFEQVASANCRK